MKDFKNIGKDVGGNEKEKCNYTFRLDTYGCGCQHDCKYCYAKSLLDFRKLWHPESPSVGDIKKITGTIKKLDGDVVRLGGMTDCFQPLEKLHRVTYKTIMQLNRRKIPYLIVTKSAMVADDEYLRLLDKDLAHIQITVTTLDDDFSMSYEKASVPSERIKAILKLQDAGFDVQMRLSPYIPDFINAKDVKKYGINKGIVEFLRVNGWISKWFDIDYSEYRVKQNGYLHLPLEKKIQYIEQVDCFDQLSVCEDEDKAYEYWKNNVNYNPEDCCNLRRSQ